MFSEQNECINNKIMDNVGYFFKNECQIKKKHACMEVVDFSN